MLIKNGKIFDGTGKDAYPGDVRVEGGRIKEIGKLKQKAGEKLVNAKDKYVVPGFIDILNHSDAYATLFDNPSQESLLRQGITTVLMGNCGSSLAPLTDGVFINSIQKWGDTSKMNVNWNSVAEYISELKRHQFGINLATLAGHSTMRRSLIQDEPRSLTGEELKRLMYMAESALQQGAFGLSFGLGYAHGEPADKNELVALGDLAKKYNALYSVHLRDESDNFTDAVQEQIEIAEKTEVNMEISHFKVLNRKNWKQFDEGLNLIARAENIHFDIYPYTQTASVLYAFLPKWATEGGNKTIFETIQKKEARKELLKAMKESSHDFAAMRVAMGAVDPTYFGRTIGDIAKNQNKKPEEAAIELILASENRIIVFNPSISEENLKKALAHPKALLSSDGVGYTREHAKEGKLAHPRYFGATVHLLNRYVNKEEVITWKEAIHKMTGAPAGKIGLKERGVIKENNFADIVVLDPEEVMSRADFRDPYRYPTGIKHVIVNGEIALDGDSVKALSGNVLTKE